MVTAKMPFAALSNRGKESSREAELEKTTEQHDGCLLGEIFLFVCLKHCIYFVYKRLVAFHKILFRCKISGHHKNYAKKE